MVYPANSYYHRLFNSTQAGFSHDYSSRLTVDLTQLANRSNIMNMTVIDNH